MSNTTRAIIYPIDVEVCKVTPRDHEVNSFRGSLVDFSMLPHRGNDEECLPPRLTPNISEDMVSKTFEATSYPLEPGIHLHWSLPKVLRTAHIQDPESTKGITKTSKISYRNVPNRWLIERTVKSGTDPITSFNKTFIIESDLLSTGDPRGSNAFPYKPANYKQGDVLYRYIGKCWGLEDWMESNDKDKIYHKNLNAFGYGEPLFSAYYPECRNVFGFHDDLEISDSTAGLSNLMDSTEDYNISYKIIGWYDNLSDDPVYLSSIEAHFKDPLSTALINDGKYISQNIEFETGKTTLKDSIAMDFYWLEKLLLHYPLLKIKINVYTDSVGSADDNLKLSQKRADVIYRIMLFSGVSYDRMSGQGYGEQNPIASNKTKEGRSKNTRVEIELTNADFSKTSETSIPFLNYIIKSSRQGFPLNWHFQNNKTSENLQDGLNARSLLIRQVDVLWTLKEDTSNEIKTLKDTKVALGNTPGQAFSALIANLAAKDPQAVQAKELMLDALQLGLLSNLDETDLIPKIDAGIHQSSFIPEEGGHLWRIQVRSNEKEMENKVQTEALKATSDEITVWNKNLRKLNSSQQEYDKLRFDILSSQKRLYADWYKFMTAEYNLRLGPVTQKAQVNEIRQHLLEQMDLLLKKFKGLDLKINEINRLKEELTEQLNDWIHQDDKLRKIYELERIAADRFWSPTEPAILFHGEDVKTSQCHDSKVDHVNIINPFLPSKSRKLVDELLEQLSSASWLYSWMVNNEKVTYPGTVSTNKETEHWTPLFLDWQVKLYPVTKPYDINNNQMSWQKNSIVKKFELEAGEIDLKLHDKGNDYKKSITDYFIKSDSTKVLQTVDGRSILTSNAHQTMVQGVKDALIDEKEGDALVKAIEDLNLLSQNLSGLNDAYLMQKQILQLSVFDPLADNKVLDNFTNTMLRKLIGDANKTSPLPHNLFLPIREGYLKISKLQMVDTFGRVRYWDEEDEFNKQDDSELSHFILAESLKKSQAGKLKHEIDKTNTKEIQNKSLIKTKMLNKAAFLPPRLSQPSRINVKLHDAKDGSHINQDHTEIGKDEIPMETDLDFNPVYGWLMPNFLDKTLYIYDTDGIPLKKIGVYTKADNSQVLQESPIPGHNTVKNIYNSYLLNAYDYLLSLNVPGFINFLNTIFESLKNVEPKNHSHFSGTALLMGKPLALIRTSIGLELKGQPAIDHNWQKRMKTYLGDASDDVVNSQMGFTRAKFPIRLGSVSQADDGLVGYFIIPDAKANSDDTHHTNNWYEYTYNEFYASANKNKLWYTKKEYNYKKSEIKHLKKQQHSIRKAQIVFPVIEGLLKNVISKMSNEEKEDYQFAVNKLNSTLSQEGNETLFFDGEVFSKHAIKIIQDVLWDFMIPLEIDQLQSYATTDFDNDIDDDEKKKIEWILSTIAYRKESYSSHALNRNDARIIELNQKLQELNFIDESGSLKSRMESAIYNAPKPEHLSLTADNKELEVFMLIDPRAKVHITSGILPVKSVEIPPEAIADAIKNIEMTFLTSPVLTPDIKDLAKDKLVIPTMKEEGLFWSWLEQEKKGSWKNYPSVNITNAPERQIGIVNKLTLREGWLKLKKNDTNNKTSEQ